MLLLSSSSRYMTGQNSTKNSCPHCSILHWHDGKHRWKTKYRYGLYIAFSWVSKKILLYFKTSSVVPYYTVWVVCCAMFHLMKPCITWEIQRLPTVQCRVRNILEGKVLFILLIVIRTEQYFFPSNYMPLPAVYMHICNSSSPDTFHR